MDERIRAALNVEASTAEFPEGLWPDILAKARRPGLQGWWARLSVLPRVGVALGVMTILMGAAGYLVVPPTKASVRTVATLTATVDQIANEVGFQVQQPAYLPAEVEFYESRVEADGVESDSKMRIAALYYMTSSGDKGMTIKQWKASAASPFPPGDTRETAMRMGNRKQVDVNGMSATLVAGNLSSLSVNLVYWHADGVNYSVSGQVSIDELLKVATSLR